MKIKLLILFIFLSNVLFAQVGIGTINPEPTSVLDIVATDKGILIPRLTVTQRIGINAPAEGLLVYQIDDIKGFYFYNGTFWTRLLDKQKDGNPTSTIIILSTSNVPLGYLKCDGSAVSRTVYMDLFNMIGVNYGAGNGNTTFNLPDYRGNFLRGFDDGAGIDPNALSRTNRGDGTTGDAVGTKQTNRFSLHHHNIDPPITATTTNGTHRHAIDPPNTATSANGNHRHSSGFYHKVGSGTSRPRILIGASNTTLYYSAYAGNHNHTVNIPPFNSANSGNHNHAVNINPFNSGNIGGSETRPTNITVMYCIKY